MITVTAAPQKLLKPLDTTKLTGVESETVIASFKRLLTLRSVIAIALMFWCAGTGCMMVSYARATMNEKDASEQLAEQSMAMSSMDAHACCKARHKSKKRNVTAERAQRQSQLLKGDLRVALPAAPSGAMSCCPLTSGSIVVASRPQTSDDASLVLANTNSLPQAKRSDSRPLSVPLRLPNRSESYLLDCVFLI